MFTWSRVCRLITSTVAGVAVVTWVAMSATRLRHTHSAMTLPAPVMSQSAIPLPAPENRKVPMDQTPQFTHESGRPQQTQRAITAIVVIWVGALLALVLGISTASGPTIATSLILLATAPLALLILLGCTAAISHRRKPPKSERVLSAAA